MKPPRTTPFRSATRARGFALLVTIVLIAFLVLILVSLATLTRVETQVATNARQHNQAQQNALTALNIALGQLQRFTGPDQRTTAPADLVASEDRTGTTTPSPTSLSVHDGTRRWTGVWGNDILSIGYTLTPGQIAGRGVSPLLMNWLVSGNEHVTFNQSANGRVTNVAGITYSPESVVEFDSDEPLAPKIDDKPAALLVGPGTVEAGSFIDYVAAPLVDIRVPTAHIPGNSASETDATIGRYAWWIGDEGVKARINLQNGYQKTEATADQINSFIVAQRDAIEFVDDASGTPLGAAAYDFNDARIPQLLSLNQLPFLALNSDPVASAVTATRLRETKHHHFHDLTSTSAGVLADSYAGGLRKDLTADLADLSSTARGALGDDNYRPADNDPIFRPNLTPIGQPNLPTWGHIRSWARTRPDKQGKVAPVAPSDTEDGLYPQVTYLSLGLNYYLDGPDDTLKLALYPLIVLHNPYPFTIAASNYDFAINAGGPFLVNVQIDNKAVTVFDATTATFINPGTSGGTGVDYFRFKITGSDIPPGESHIYLLPDSAHATDYDPQNPVRLERAPDDEAIGTTNFIVLNGPPLAPLTPPEATESSRIRLLLPSTSLQRLELGFMLGREDCLLSAGNLTSWDPARHDGWYQAMVNTRGGSHALAGNTLCDLTGNGSLLTARRSGNGHPSITAATSAFRIGSSFDAQNFWSTSTRLGQPINMRTYAIGSFRAPFIAPTKLERDSYPINNFERRRTVGTPTLGSLIAGPGDVREPHPFFINERYAANFGFWLDASKSAGESTVRHAILYDLLDSPDHFLSLGQLQHAPLARYSFHPTNPFGNAYADPRVSRNRNHETKLFNRPGSSTPGDTFYDLSWHLNRNIWDRYFVSGVPVDWTQGDIDSNRPLPNARLTYFQRDGAPPALADIQHANGSPNTAYNQAAANLLVDGSFNINSTSEQAWRAILGGPSGLPADDTTYAETGDAVDTIIPYPRFSHNPVNVVQAGGPYTIPDQTMVVAGAYTQPNFLQTAYLGNRGLMLNAPDNVQTPNRASVVAELARSIVREIRRRGPFLSLADFVNRPITASTDPTGIKGALQAGIDGMGPDTVQVNPAYWLNDFPYKAVANPTAFGFPAAWDPEHTIGGALSDRGSGRDSYRLRSAMSPKFLTQADLLSSLGPRLSARSDTFLIRTYGESLDLVNSTEDHPVVLGRAWCEAIVQRIPDYIDSTVNPLPEKKATGINATLGRRYRVVSFRWLSPEEI